MMEQVEHETKQLGSSWLAPLACLTLAHKAWN